MQTRREIIKSGLGLAGIIAAGKAPAAIIKSMIGARNAFTVGSGGWMNPYVTDGLIAMWDGEWNAGGGVHDASATTWTDLGPNGIDAPIANTPFAIRDNAVVFKGKQCSFQNVLAATCVQLEIVCQRSIRYVSDSTRSVVTVGETLFWRGEDTQSSGPIGCSYWNTQTNNGPGFGISDVETVSNPIAVSWTQVFANANSQYAPRAYVNGAVVPSNRWHFIGTYWGAPSNTIRFGNTNAVDGETSLFCVRAYNRVLESSEIAANYAIDKQRFNLS